MRETDDSNIWSVCFHGFPGWVLPRISPKKEDKHARRLEKQSQLCQRTKRNQEGTSKSNTRSDMKKTRLGTTRKLKMLRPKSVKKTHPRNRHKVQLGSLLTGESSLLIFVKWEKHAMPQLIHKDARRQLMRASHQRWEEMKLADQLGGVREDPTQWSPRRQLSWFMRGRNVLGKISAQPHTVVKQICFPNGNVLFLSLFSLSKNWMHDVEWGCVEILPQLITSHFSFEL